MSSEFTRKQGFKLNKIKRPIYVRNINGIFNKERPIEHIEKMNIFYKRYRERMKIDVIREQKWNIFLGMLQLAHHNLGIDWKIEKVKITRYSEESGKQ